MGENKDQKNSEYGHFLRNVAPNDLIIINNRLFVLWLILKRKVYDRSSCFN